MKFLTIALLSLISAAAFADKDWDKMTFEQQKQMKLQKLDEKEAKITKRRMCVNQAKDKEALRACRHEWKK